MAAAPRHATDEKPSVMSTELASSIDLGAAYALLALTVLDPLVFVFGLIAISILRSRSEPSRMGYTAWVVTFFVLALLWLIGIVFGFGIHATGPGLADKLVIQAPFFLVSIAMIAVAIRLALKLRR